MELRRRVLGIEFLRRLGGERGIAMLVGLIIVVMLATLGLGLTLTTMTEKSTSHNFRQSAQSLTLAQSGVQLGIHGLRNLYRVNYDNPFDAEGRNVLEIGYNVPMERLVPAGGNLPSSFESGATTVSAQLLGYTPGIPNASFPQRTYRVSGRGQIVNSRARADYESVVRLTDYVFPFPPCGVCTPGPNTGSGPFKVNAFNESNQPIPVISVMPNPFIQKILEDNADFTISGDLTNQNSDTVQLTSPPGEAPQPSFWKKHPTREDGSDGTPWIIVVNGNLQIGGSTHLKGIIYVKGDTVDLNGNSTIDGILYAPNVNNTDNPADIHGGASPANPVIDGGMYVGPGGVHAAGNHSDVRRDTKKENGMLGVGAQVMNWSRRSQQ